MRKITHLLSEEPNSDLGKVSTFNTDAEFIAFVKQIVKENDDEGELFVDTVGQAENYINEYCDNLVLTLI
jgi:hypothetical protein